MKVIFTIAGTAVIVDNDGSIVYWGPAMIDGDGTGLPHGDPDYQSTTSYKPDLNADIDCYIVLPPQVIKAVAPIVLGCKAEVLNTITGLWTPAVVGDVGPHSKIGEISIATAEAIGVPSSPTTGGISDRVIYYRVYPGVPAVVNGKTYTLQASS